MGEFTPVGKGIDLWRLYAGPRLGQGESSGPHGVNRRFYAPAVRLHELEESRRNRVLVFGGGSYEPHPVEPTTEVSQATGTVEELVADFTGLDPAGQWHPKTSMQHPRVLAIQSAGAGTRLA